MNVSEWREAAMRDGWDAHPLYKNESIEQATKLTNGDWVAHVIDRETYQSVSVWGPDRLQICVPANYNMLSLERRLRHCTVCDATNVDTQRYSFAGRCCAECRPEMARFYEFPGWTN